MVNFSTNDEVKYCGAFIVARVTQNFFSSSGFTKLFALWISCIEIGETE